MKAPSPWHVGTGPSRNPDDSPMANPVWQVSVTEDGCLIGGVFGITEAQAKEVAAMTQRLCDRHNDTLPKGLW